MFDSSWFFKIYLWGDWNNNNKWNGKFVWILCHGNFPFQFAAPDVSITEFCVLPQKYIGSKWPWELHTYFFFFFLSYNAHRMFDIIIIIIRFAPAERDDIYFLKKKMKKMFKFNTIVADEIKYLKHFSWRDMNVVRAHLLPPVFRTRAFFRVRSFISLLLSAAGISRQTGRHS